MLDFQLKQTPFRYGLAEDTDPHAVPFGVLTKLENFVWTKSARIQKRLGVNQLTNAIFGGGTITAGVRIFALGDELCVVDGTKMYSFSTPLASWRNVGPINDLGIQKSTLVDPPVGVATSDVAISATGLVVSAWTVGDGTGNLGVDSTGLFVQVMDAAGSVVMPPTQLQLTVTTTTMGVRVLIIGTKAVILTRRGAASPYAIYGHVVDLTTLTVTTFGTSLKADITTLQGSAGWDACVVGTNFVIAYNRGVSTIALESFNVAFAPQASGVGSDANGCTSIAIDGTAGESLYVFYSQGVATPRPVRLAVHHPTTLAQVVAPTTVEAPAAGSAARSVSVCRRSAADCIVSYYMYTGNNEIQYTTMLVSNLGVVTANSRRITYWAIPTTRPAMLNGRCYVGVNLIDAGVGSYFGSSSAVLEVIFTLDAAAGGSAIPHRFMGLVDLLIGGSVPRFVPLANIATLSATKLLASVPFLSAVTASANNWRQGIRSVVLSIGASLPADMWRTVPIGQEAYIAGGALTAYDGRMLFNYGFTTAPFIAALLTAGAGGAIAAGTYNYGAVEEFRSSAGMLHRSPTAKGASILTVGATSTNTLNVSGGNAENKQNAQTAYGFNAGLQTLVAMYRTTVNGTVLQRLTFEPTYNVIAADLRASSRIFIDTRADAAIDGLTTTLGSRPAIYTSGGVLDDYEPPAGITSFYHVDRLWQLDGDGITWWYSKTFRDDIGVAPGFNAQFRVVFDRTQTCGASLDDKAIFFSPTKIAYMLGNGPSKNGANSDFSSPIPLPSDIGCVNARSLVSTPDGLIFEGIRGLYLLARNLELVWIGRPVKDQLALFPTITSAVLVAKHNEIRFTCNDGVSGIVLVYNYVEKQWSTAKYIQDAAGLGVIIADACIHGNEWTFLTSGGLVYKENADSSLTAYLDNGAYVPGVVETAWISSAGPLAYHAVRNFWLTGSSSSDHGVTIDIAFNSSDSFDQTREFLARSAVTSVSSLEELKIQVGKRRKCNSIKFRISDAAPWTPGSVLGTGKGPSYETMAIEVGVIEGDPMSARKKG